MVVTAMRGTGFKDVRDINFENYRMVVVDRALYSRVLGLFQQMVWNRFLEQRPVDIRNREGTKSPL